MTINYKIIIIALGVFTITACGGGVVRDVPSKPRVDTKYIYYLHGSAEESSGATDKYHAAVNAIATGSATVISEVRSYTDPNRYAQKLKQQVDLLLANGVPAKNITITGFSKGSIIALAAAGAINNPQINYVLLAGCSAYLNDKYDIDADKAAGRILSIYDSGDEKFESCEGTIKPSARLHFEEIDLDSGKGHKVFRIPKDKFIELWRDPLLDCAGA